MRTSLVVYNTYFRALTDALCATTWIDPEAIERYDEEHSRKEDRWIRIGRSLRGAILVTWTTVRQIGSSEAIRIIGSRRATRNEQRIYEEEANL
jgi:uncharacterized DUF497 family protein